MDKPSCGHFPDEAKYTCIECVYSAYQDAVLCIAAIQTGGPKNNEWMNRCQRPWLEWEKAKNAAVPTVTHKENDDG